MGKEAQVGAVFADGADEGLLQYEPPKLIFRGAQRRVFQAEDLAGVRAEGDDLVLSGGARFRLGAKAAAGWADAIANPKGRLEKLGVRAGARVAVLGVPEPSFAEELAAAGAVLADRSDLDLLFFQADGAADLARIPELIPRLGAKGALWIVSHKGKAATLKDVEVMAAAKAHGLVDSKVVSVSDSLTALRFTRRKG